MGSKLGCVGLESGQVLWVRSGRSVWLEGNGRVTSQRSGRLRGEVGVNSVEKQIKLVCPLYVSHHLHAAEIVESRDTFYVSPHLSYIILLKSLLHPPPVAVLPLSVLSGPSLAPPCTLT